eukprot:7054953-Alexandrium_andersonii.AAC.1
MECDQSYVARVRNEAQPESLPITWRPGGRASLGLVVSREAKVRAAEEAPPTAWLIRGCKTSWTDAAVANTLQSAGWRD